MHSTPTFTTGPMDISAHRVGYIDLASLLAKHSEGFPFTPESSTVDSTPPVATRP
jgi:hypothetical protein